MGLFPFFFISVYGFCGNNFHENLLDKSHHDFRGKPRKNTYFRFLKIHQENSSNSTNFISSILSHWWILIFVNTENYPPEIRIHRKIRWKPESTERETSPLSFSNPTDSPIWLHFLVILHLPCGHIKI